MTIRKKASVAEDAAESAAARCEPVALSVAEVAAQLGLGVPTLRRMIRRRQIAHVRLNRRVGLLPEDVRAYLTAHRVPAESEVRRTDVRRKAVSGEAGTPFPRGPFCVGDPPSCTHENSDR